MLMVGGGRSQAVLVDLATGANLRNDDVEALYLEEDPETPDPGRSPVVPALQRLQVFRGPRISKPGSHSLNRSSPVERSRPAGAPPSRRT